MLLGSARLLSTAPRVSQAVCCCASNHSLRIFQLLVKALGCNRAYFVLSSRFAPFLCAAEWKGAPMAGLVGFLVPWIV